MIKTDPASRIRVFFIACVSVAIGIAAGPATLAQSQGLTNRPLFHEPSTGNRFSLAEEDFNSLLAVEWIVDGERYLTYNRTIPGQTIFMEPGGQHEVEVSNCLPHLTVDELALFNPPVLMSSEPDSVKDLISEQSSVTNLHTHGLHTSPQGRADNVLLKINHGRQNLYTYDLPPDHAPGTHWYHAHLHGATALQVQGGMAGALIVTEPEGQSLNPPGFPVQERLVFLRAGDPAEIPPEDMPEDLEPTLRERVQFRQQEDKAERRDDAARRLNGLIREGGLATLIQGMKPEDRQKFNAALADLLPDPPTFEVNGMENPVLYLLPGEIQRLRIVNAGSRKSDVKEVWVTDHDMYLAAYDGINLTHLPKDANGNFVAYNKDNPLLLDPGNRADVYFIPNAIGSAELMMQAEMDFALPEGNKGAQKFTQTLMTFQISNSDFRMRSLKSAGEAQKEVDVFLEALDANLKRLQETPPYQGYLRPFASAPALEREMTFEIDPPGGSFSRTFYINGRDYNANMAGMTDYLGRDDRDGGQGPSGQTPFPPRAGTDESWIVTNTSTVIHPFHIHVNPFWVYDITQQNDQGVLVSLREQNPNDPRLNRWQDTIELPANGGSVTMWHRFSDFDGLFVLHCHILQHEDRGMMMNVMVVPNDTENPEEYFQQQMADNEVINQEIENSTNPYCSPETQ